jgi:sarcosine oxidase subunit beta
LYAGTPDYHPVIERSCPGLFTAAGFSGTGLMHAPAVGMLVSELIRFGEAQSLGISGLSSSRFAESQATKDGSGF